MMKLSITTKQKSFIDSPAFETLFGGAAGGGKSYAQIVDAFLYAMKYPKSKQIIFRRTFADLELSLIRTTQELYPKEVADYNSSKHTWKLKNGSVVDFGYIDKESDVYRYQSAEYDVIRFDELTHFTEYMYVYMISRCRGANNYPKAIKSSTNPGNVGHTWVKKRFIDLGPANNVYDCKNDDGSTTTRIFIPSLVQDNKFLMESDPDYVKRLNALPEKDRRALKDGDWDIYDGQYFGEFKRSVHVIAQFEIPNHWDRYIAFDYGLDKFAALFFAVDPKGKAYIYNYIHKEGLIVSEAAHMLKSYMRGKEYKAIYAPPDLWATDRHTGKSTAEVFRENGVFLTKSSNARVAGWYAIKEWLKIIKRRNEHTGELEEYSNLAIFETIIPLIEYLPAIQHDEKNPNDCATEPHEITHICDALRYFCISRISPSKEVSLPKEETFDDFFEIKINYDYGEEIEVI